MILAVAYARVSTEDQAKKHLSIPEQMKEMEAFAAANGYRIARTFKDEGISAYRDTERPGFEMAILFAEQNKEVRVFLVHDTTRFARNKHQSALYKMRLKKSGVSVIPIATPYDPSTIAGLWQESIYETQAQADSMMTSFHVRKGMRSNIHARDTETGWCYKNGGRAPYGYRNVRLVRGKDTRGKDIVKQIWLPNEDTAPILQWIIRDLRIDQRLGYKAIMQLLNERAISGPEGKPWNHSTVRELLSEDRVMQYAGVAYWNKWAPRGSGTKFNPRSQWEVEENAHPALITLEEARLALNANLAAKREATRARANASDYLLSGNNANGEPILICAECGAHMLGSTHSKGNRYYVCSEKVYRGNCSSRYVKMGDVDRVVLEVVRSQFSDSYIAALIDVIRQDNSEADAKHAELVSRLESKVVATSREIDNLLVAVSRGLDAALVITKVDELKLDKEKVQRELDEARAAGPEFSDLGEEVIRDHIRGVESVLNGGNVPEMKRALRQFVSRVECSRKQDSVVVHLVFSLEQKSTRALTLVPESLGVGGGT